MEKLIKKVTNDLLQDYGWDEDDLDYYKYIIESTIKATKLALTIPVVNCQREQLPEKEYCECLTEYRFDKNGLCEGCGAKKG